MLQGIRDLFDSERGTWCFVVLAVVTIALFLGKIDAPSWLSFIANLTTLTVASKTVTTAVETRTAGKAPAGP